MAREILVNASPYEMRVAILEGGEIVQLYWERQEDRNVVGNIYKGVVKRVLPGMQAAFLELGLERTAFLYVDDIIEQPLGRDFEYEGELGGEPEASEDKKDQESEGAADPAVEEAERFRTLNEGTDEASASTPPPKKAAPARSRQAASGGRGRWKRGGRGGSKERRNLQIDQLIKEGQELLVQVAKAPIGTKGARLTTHIGLPGRNVVLMPTVRHLGISRRIENSNERLRLRDLFMKRIRPQGVGFIIRTVAAGKSFREIKSDTDYLTKLWTKVQRDAKRKSAPALIHEDLSLALRTVRDFFSDDIQQLIVDDAEEYERILQFVGQFMPRLRGRVRLFQGPKQLFEHYGIESEISRALGKKVWLKSGGYLLIDQSEALTAIDVNTGRYVGSKSLEETILKTNLEAINEIAYQLRIRNVGGIIIIDLIDMELAENRDKVYRALSEALGEDRAKTNILKISELGLVEMTRKRTHEDLVRYLTESCQYCEGRGYHKSLRTICFEIFREVEKEALSRFHNIVVFAHPKVVDHMAREEKEYLGLLEKKIERPILVKTDPQLQIEQFEVFGRY